MPQLQSASCHHTFFSQFPWNPFSRIYSENSIHAKQKTSKMNSRTHSLFPICQISSSWLFSCQVFPSNVSTTKACTNHFPVLLCTTQLAKHFHVLLCTTKLAQTTSQYYFVLQSLHKLLPSTTLYCKACTKHFPGLLCTTKLAQTTSQYYFVLQSLQSTSQYCFVLQSLHKLLPSTNLAQNTSQYYFVMQSLHKALPSTTLYYKACTNYFPVLLCTTKLTTRRRLARERKRRFSSSSEYGSRKK